MPTGADLQLPSSPMSLSFRPMNAGMVTSETSMLSPDGSFRNIEGFDVSTRGLVRLGGWQPSIFDYLTGFPLALEQEFSGERLEDLAQVWLSDGSSVNMVISSSCLYTMDKDKGYKTIYWGQEFAIDTVAGEFDTTFTVIGDFRELYISTSDYVVIGTEKFRVTSVTATVSELTITADGLFLSEPGPGGTFKVLKPFQAADEYFVDFTFGRNVLYLVDGQSAMVFKYSGGEYLQPHIMKSDAGVRTVMGARTVTFFADRLYFGDIIEYDILADSTFMRQRIRWTEVSDLNICKSSSYQDLVRSQGRIIKLLGLGNLMVAYLSDSIYYGRQTNLTTLPYAFYLMETSGITALGMKAITSFFDGQVFAGQDNVYLISPDISIQPIGTPIAETLAYDTKTVHMTKLLVDTDRTRLIIAIATNTTDLDKLYMYNYRSKAWATSELGYFAAMAAVQFNDELYYFELDADDTYETTYLRNNSFVSLLTGPTNKQLLSFQNNGFLRVYNPEYSYSELATTSGVTQRVELTQSIETQDYDFGDADLDKTALRLGLKITSLDGEVQDQRVLFKVEGSTNRGATWKDLGTLRISPGLTEDYVNFRLTGSTLRFRISKPTNITTEYKPFEISELTLRVRGRSIETPSGSSARF